MGILDDNLFYKLLAMMQDPRMAVNAVFRMTFCIRKSGRINVDSKLDLLQKHADDYWKIRTDVGWAYSEPVGYSKGAFRTGSPMYTIQWYMERR